MKSKLKILDMLYGAEGYISGEELAGRLGVSRTAVWKQIQELVREGFVVEAKPRLGYKVVSYPDRLLPVMLRRGLATSVIGRDIYYYQRINSTNLMARSLAEKGAIEGSVVIAEEQVEGRGRCGRHWVSPQGVNILASVILRPRVLPHQVSWFAILGALSVADSIRRLTGLEVELRWPNEVLLNSRRVGGVLVEFDAELDRVDFVILGIGLNVNFDLAGSPELVGEATSLSYEAGVCVSRLALLRTLLEQIEGNYRLLGEGKFHLIAERWNNLCWHRDKWVHIAREGGGQGGFLRGIDDNGYLIISNVDGETRVPMDGDALVKEA